MRWERFGHRISGLMHHPITLSQAIDLVAVNKQTGRKRPHWFDSPVRGLIEVVGDKPITEVTPGDIHQWWDHLRTRAHQRQPSKHLSLWTIDSYGRQVRAFFNELVRMGHLDQSPAHQLKLPRLPTKAKKEIDQNDIQKMIDASEYNARDNAMILVLRDSGVRVGELVDMTVDGLTIKGDHGRILITDEKTHTARYAFLGPQALEAIRRYIRSRPHDAPDWLWLSHNRSGAKPARLTKSGVYQALERVAERAGVDKNWNPHAFRHALAKRLVKEGAPAKIVQGILGHSDITTTLNMYVIFDDDELAEYHRRLVAPG
jgi:site-specific recombinase XerD